MGIVEKAGRLAADEQGIYRAPDTPPLSYPEEGSANCFRLEDRSFWFRHRNRCILSAVRRFPPAGTILDVGGGNGFVTKGLLDQGYDAALMEPSPTGALNGKTQRHIPEVLCSTLEGAGLPDHSLDAVGCFDVLEHIKDDREFVRQAGQVLKPGGLLYLTVPAFGWLWSASDVETQHFRRYDVRQLRRVMEGVFEILYTTYFFSALVLPSLLLRSLPFRLGRGHGSGMSDEQEHGTGGGAAVKVMTRLLERELRTIERGGRKRMGVSCLCVARSGGA